MSDEMTFEQWLDLLKLLAFEASMFADQLFNTPSEAHSNAMAHQMSQHLSRAKECAYRAAYPALEGEDA